MGALKMRKIETIAITNHTSLLIKFQDFNATLFWGPKYGCIIHIFANKLFLR